MARHLLTRSDSIDGVELVEIRVDSDGGFIDFDLTMLSFHRAADGVQNMSARGLYNGRVVGFGVSLSPTWERQDLEDSRILLYWGEATLISLGEESDAFLQGVDKAYQTNLGHQKMRDRISFTAVALDGDPLLMGDLPINMKLFSQTDNEEQDAEFYLNIDTRNSSVQFHEKDTDYRRGVVLALSASTN